VLLTSCGCLTCPCMSMNIIWSLIIVDYFLVNWSSHCAAQRMDCGGDCLCFPGGKSRLLFFLIRLDLHFMCCNHWMITLLSVVRFLLALCSGSATVQGLRWAMVFIDVPCCLTSLHWPNSLAACPGQLSEAWLVVTDHWTTYACPQPGYWRSSRW